ncbi:MAG: serine/threonine-protein kinase, partial [Planctomycetota bacterium]|nr:serine/threonine-protein kinase [Planctomycetota bacterium]
MQAIGSKVGDYKLLELLGEGAKSEVFRAKHEVLEEIVALKILRDKDQVERLVHEAKILNKLNHSSIISLKAVSLRSDPPFVAMELIEGQSLRALLQQNGPLDLETGINITRSILSALEYAHNLGIVHGDLKPENILIDHSQKPYLVDFGFAAIHSESALNISDSMTENTLSYGGTLGYAAPEQLKGEDLDGRADLYSLGVVIFEMLTGQRPEPGDKPSDLRSELPAFLDELFIQCYCR